jgi:hypothetical protein
MERVLIGLLVLGFMLGTILVAARLAVRRSGMAGQDPEPARADRPRQTGPDSSELAGLVDSALHSALD